MELSAGGERMRSLPNAGGSSEISEILSYEMLRRCFGAQLVKVSGCACVRGVRTRE